MTDDGPTLTQREFVTLKSRLTRARNRAKEKNDPQIIIEECNRAFAIFSEKGYPDSWNKWQVAHDDARYALERKNAGLDFIIR